MNYQQMVMPGNPAELFELQELVGSGSYGSVFKARYKTTGAMAAVKVINLEPGESLQEVLIEVNILRQCNHPNIVSYFGCYMTRDLQDKPQLWIGMEYCAGGSLETIYKVTRRGYSEREIQCLLFDAINGLAYLHRENKIHRDIKCGNLLLTHEGQVKLADFGVSAQLTHTMSKRKSVIGSPYWMAPEVISAEDTNVAYNEKADIWSIGITAIEMAECAPPLYDLHPMRALFMIPKHKPPTLTKKDRWSNDFNDFLAICLQKNPKKRPDAKALLNHPFIAKAAKLRPPVVIREIVDRYALALAAPATPMGEASAAPVSNLLQDSDEDDDTITAPGAAAAAAAAAPSPVAQAPPSKPPSVPIPSAAAAAAIASPSPLASPAVAAASPAFPSPSVLTAPSPVMATSAMAAAAAGASASPVAEVPLRNPFGAVPTDTIRRASMLLHSDASTVRRAGGVTQQKVDEYISELVIMGFTRDLAISALTRCNNDLHSAVSWLLEGISSSANDEGSSSPPTSASDLLESESSSAQPLPTPQTPADIQRQLEEDERLARQLSAEAMAEEEAQRNDTIKPKQTAVVPAPHRFQLERICGMRHDNFHCGDLWEGEDILFLGLESGLAAVDFSNRADRRLLRLSERAYYSLMVLEDITVMVSIAGHSREVFVHDLAPLLLAPPPPPSASDRSRRESKVTRFEQKTRVKAVSRTKNTEAIQIDRVRSSIFLLITRPKYVLLITNWAPHPYNKFMSVKEVAFDRPWNCVAMHEGENGELRLFVGFTGYFQIVDLDNGTVMDVQLGSSPTTQLGMFPLAALHMSKYMLLVFEECLVPVDFDGQPFGNATTLPTPVAEAVKIGPAAVALICKDRSVEVRAAGSGHLITRYAEANVERVRLLRHTKNHRALFVRLEMRDARERHAVVYSLTDIFDQNPHANRASTIITSV